MGTVITVILAILIFGFGLTQFFKAIKKEAIEGKCAGCSGCGSDKDCRSKQFVELSKFDDAHKS